MEGQLLALFLLMMECQGVALCQGDICQAMMEFQAGACIQAMMQGHLQAFLQAMVECQGQACIQVMTECHLPAFFLAMMECQGEACIQVMWESHPPWPRADEKLLRPHVLMRKQIIQNNMHLRIWARMDRRARWYVPQFWFA